ncbi:MAG TPA: cytochrome c3 family protein [Candidatus Binatia bacterium]|nr:cytochrome c3 family protein [Candidatus Binatia bacterium]
MPQIFHPSTNTLSRVSIAGAVLTLVLVATVGGALFESTYLTGVDVPEEQPVPFSHAHHAGGLGIDCRYCHGSVETAAFAGIPATEVCMNCHRQIWSASPMLEPVRASFRSGTPLRWNRVHDLPGFAYFDHGIHVQKGVGCVTCHGRVDEMPLVWRASSLYMQWCLGCHREPWRYVRPREHVFDLAWQPAEDQETLGRRLVKEYAIMEPHALTSCSVCHR